MSVIMVMMMIVVMVVMMLVMVFVVIMHDFLLAVDTDGKVRRRDAAAGDGLADEFDARDAEGVQFVECGLLVGLKLKKGGGKHVACGAH